MFFSLKMLLNLIILVLITLDPNYLVFSYRIESKNVYIPNQIGKLNIRLPGRIILLIACKNFFN